MKYECNNCHKVFTCRSGLKYHQSNNVCVKKDYVCKYCPKTFTTETSMYRHMRTVCKQKAKQDDEYIVDADKDEQIKELRNELLALKKEMMEMKNMQNTSINNGMINNTNNSNNTMNVMINLSPYGSEDMSKIDRNDLLKAFRCGFNSPLQLTETMHFNPKYPEFHNIYISSMKNKYAMMYDGTDWELVMKDDLIDKLYDNKRNYIEENLEDFLESLTKSQVAALHRWMDADESHPYVQKIKNDIKLLLYNKRKLITNPRLSESYYVPETPRVIRQPKGNIIDAPFRSTVMHNTRTTKASKSIAPRNGSKRKIIKARK